MRKGRRFMGIALVVILVVVVGILIYWNIGYSPNKSSFNKSIYTRIDKTEEAEGIYNKEEIEKLPEAMQRYFNYIDCIGKEKNNIVNIYFKDTYFYMEGKELSIDYDLWLFSDKPYRSACITSSMYGIPFEGMDYFNESTKEGGMKGVVGKAITIFDTHNKQMYSAGLISWMIEGVYNPTILLSDYITYNQIDNNHVEATIEYDGAVGKGIYTIDDEGKIIEFESWERQVENIDGVDNYLGWICKAEDYQYKNDIKVPLKISATTVYPDKEEKYFDADNIKINYYK